MQTPRPWFADWTQYVCPGPNRRFTADEMARGGADPFPRGLGRYIALNALVLFVALGLVIHHRQPAAALVVGLATGLCALGAYYFGRSLWQRPTRLRLNVGGLALMLAVGVVVGAASHLAQQEGRLAAKSAAAVAATSAVVAAMVAVGWYFLAMYRVQQIEGRLRERDAQDARDALQRRLATAQIHPHFVFNTLASLTHWVETQDARAAPLLRDFNAYLRATLPMFEREQQPLAEELALVRHYLAIMQARLGERLSWQLQADPALHAVPLPPGSLLTLVENAITHGIEPSLRGGRIDIAARAEAGVHITVADSGAGLAGEAPTCDGLGLANTRQRLLALHPGATLQLAANAQGGCTATLHIPA